MTLWETLLDPFGYEFFVKGLVAAVLAGRAVRAASASSSPCAA